MKVVLVGTESSGNIGSIARVMKNFSVAQLYLLNPATTITEESKKLACNAQEILNNTTIINSLKECGADYYVGTTALKGGSYNIVRNTTSLEEVKNNEQTALVLGSESQGLSNELLQELDITITIPASQEYNTLNISHALAIILYEINKQEIKEELLATTKQKERLLKEFLTNIDKTGMTVHEEETAKKAFKKLLGRAKITKREIQALFGSFKRL